MASQLNDTVPCSSTIWSFGFTVKLGSSASKEIFRNFSYKFKRKPQKIIMQTSKSLFYRLGGGGAGGGAYTHTPYNVLYREAGTLKDFTV